MVDSVLALGVIPARASSSRFPRKVVARILDKPMVQYVWELTAGASRLNERIIATDDTGVAEVVRAFGGRAEMTPSNCPSGSDRVALVAKHSKAEIVVNIQADEPLLDATAIDQLVDALLENPDARIATLAVRKSDSQELVNPNIVKVVTNLKGEALYFSRAPLKVGSSNQFLKHIGIYAYRRKALFQFCELPPSPLEREEKLEQLRALEAGMRIQVVEILSDTIAVDSPEDIARVEAYLSKKRVNTLGAR